MGVRWQMLDGMCGTDGLIHDHQHPALELAVVRGRAGALREGARAESDPDEEEDED